MEFSASDTDAYLWLTGSGGVSASSEQADEHHHSRGQHLLDHILHEVDKGHVTSASMHYWSDQLSHALHDGSLMQEQMNAFMAELHQKIPQLDSVDSCCMFG